MSETKGRIMASLQIADSTASSTSSMEDIERFFEAQSSHPNEGSVYSLPVGEDYKEPESLPSHHVDEGEFENRHRNFNYPHVHLTLRSDENRRKRKKKKSKVENKENRKMKKGSRPSQLFQPSLHQVVEQRSTPTNCTFSDSSEWGYLSTVSDQEVVRDDESNSSTSKNAQTYSAPVNTNQGIVTADTSDIDLVDSGHAYSAPASLTIGSRDTVKFTVGDASTPELKKKISPTSRTTSSANNNSEQPLPSNNDDQSVHFMVGGGSEVSLEGLNNNQISAYVLPKPQQLESNKRSYSFHPGDELALRRRRGSDVELTSLSMRRVPTITTPEEAVHLNKSDLEELASHRLENVRGIRRHKIDKRNMSKISSHPDMSKPIYDLTPHQLFVELDELTVTQEADEGDEHQEYWEWQEKARWIKFEEDVLGKAGRWGRPHVASLSFHSLIELRRVIENGLVSLDVEVSDYVNLMSRVVDQMVVSGQLDDKHREYVMNAFLLRHSHLTEKRFLRSKSYSNLRGLDSMSRHTRHGTFLAIKADNNNCANGDRRNTHAINMDVLDESQGPLLRPSRSHGHNMNDDQYNLDLLRKIPLGAEVASVLVGTLKELEKPAVAFVRLARGVDLDHLAEVPLPVRFLFICVGPPNPNMEYLQIGRSLSTLMANENFHNSVYGAKDRQTILQAMNVFLDSSMVLPPGDFDKNTLLPIMYMAKKKLAEKKAKEEAETALLPDTDGEVHYAAGGGEDEDPLNRVGRPFGGLVRDLKTRYPKYWTDIKDGLSPQVLAAFIFIYFAALAPAITFGGLMADKTDKLMGAAEMMLASAVGGLIFSLFAGQPLLIVGATGPLMVFEEGVYQFAQANGIDFLAWRVWIGIWVCIIAIVCVAAEASFLVKFVSRFTQEVFAFLISLIFIYEVFVKLSLIFREYPLCHTPEECAAQTITVSTPVVFSTPSVVNVVLNATGNLTTVILDNSISNDVTPIYNTTMAPGLEEEMFVMTPNTALLSMSLTLGTFSIAYYLKGMRNKKVLGRTIRRALGDFGVPLAILIMCLIDVLIGDDVFTQKLTVPTGFRPTSDERGWIINPLGTPGHSPLPIGHMFSAALPALLASILIFLETLICGMIVNKKENKLRKGTGFHLDILLMGGLALLYGFFGLPFVCCATVRSVSHVSALTVMSRNTAPGVTPKLEKILEQRVSNFMVHVLIGCSLFLGAVLRYIPTAVLFGVFLYMGIASLGGIQLFQRCILLITPTKHHPVDVGFVRYVRVKKMHIFTLIQLLCLGVLWGVKSSPAALAFPFILILLVPVRKFALKYIFSEDELSQLDAADSCEVIEKNPLDDEEPDFYETAHMPQ